MNRWWFWGTASLCVLGISSTGRAESTGDMMCRIGRSVSYCKYASAAMRESVLGPRKPAPENKAFEVTSAPPATPPVPDVIDDLGVEARFLKSTFPTGQVYVSIDEPNSIASSPEGMSIRVCLAGPKIPSEFIDCSVGSKFLTFLTVADFTTPLPNWHFEQRETSMRRFYVNEGGVGFTSGTYTLRIQNAKTGKTREQSFRIEGPRPGERCSYVSIKTETFTYTPFDPAISDANTCKDRMCSGQDCVYSGRHFFNTGEGLLACFAHVNVTGAINELGVCN